MNSRVRALGLSLALWTSLSAVGESPRSFYQEGTGVIDGRAALAVVPTDRSSGSTELLDPSGLEVHLAPHDHDGEELSFPAGSWYLPPPGRYRVWLQGGWRMTPFSGLVILGSASAKGGMKGGYPVGPAGRVTLAETHAGPNLELHLLHAGSYLEEGYARWEISPRRVAAQVGDGVLMPEGKAIGGLWDLKSQRYVAFSRPFEVSARQTVAVPLEKPGEESFLLAQLKRGALAGTATGMKMDLTLKSEGGERPPDIAIFTANRVYAVWYGLAPGPAELRGESEHSILEPQQVSLQPGKIERLTAELRPRPALDVQLDLPAALRREKLALEVRRLPTGEVLDHLALDGAADSHRFERLPAALLKVELQTGLGSFAGQVDLSSGRDGFLVLKPDLITLAGTVYLGDEGHPAKLTFANAARETEARTEADGRYEMVSLEPVTTVSIVLDGVERTPYFDFFSPSIAESRQLDFHLPDGDFQVRVLDAVTGKGIPKASVTLRNGFQMEEEDSEKKERAVFQSSKTDDTGVVRLPPLRAGTLDLRASADGYSKSSQELKAQILDENAEQTFEIRLEPLGETVAVRLRLPDGAPASGAQVMLVDSLAAGNALFSAAAQGDGLVRPPRQQKGVLLIRHPAAAFLVRDWSPREDEGGVEWALPPAADRPLMLQIRESTGRSVAPRADLALWIEGRRLSGGLLAWLAGSAPMADVNGYWMAKNLPRTPVQILAWGPRVQEDARAGNLDSQATGVPFPWPDPVEVRALD
jgi:hypothetical protein